MRYSCFLIIIPILVLSSFEGHAQIPVQLVDKSIVLPTYKIKPPDKNPIFFRGEAYQGASRYYYPLALNDQFVQKKENKAWQTLILENEYIEVGITPEIGGKLYYATDKTNGYNFIYKNNVVRPSNIGMTGAWVSGGIEWCVLHHHRASTFLPVDYTTTENEDGSKTVWVGEYEPRHGMRWIIGITVFPGKSYYKTEGRIYNSSPFTHSFLFWANVATHTNENYQTIFPSGAQVVTYHSKTDFAQWPVSYENYRRHDFTEGVDISWWKNVESSNSFFVHELKEDYMGGYDHGRNSGTIHIGDHNIIKGAKLWEWGSGPRGQATEARLTENDGPYVELMVGAYSDNQPDYSWIRPYEVKRWEQFWYPVKGIEGFKFANLNGAVNLEEREGNKVFLGYYSTQKIDNAKVILKNKEEVIYEKNLLISPDKPFSEVIQLKDDYNYTDLYTELKNSGSNEILIDFRPVKPEQVTELPDPWKGYPAPDELETVEEIYLTGKRIEQFYAPRYNPMDWYKEALNRDPGDIRTNTAVGNFFLKNGNYEMARSYFSRAIKRLTQDYTRPSTCEALYLQGITLKALGLYDEAIDTLYRATWDYAYHSSAYLHLAQISLMHGDFEKALNQINESLWTNGRNNRAVALKASIQRKSGNIEAAIATLQPVLNDDPLDFRARNEFYLALKAKGENQKADNILLSLKREMRNFHENYLELAVGYIHDGLLDEAEAVLQRFPSDYPIVDYYLGFINDKKGDRDLALKHFSSASVQNTDYVFPHRMETVEALKKALEYNPKDGKAHYFMGNILFDKQPEKAIVSWEKAVALNPDLAIAYRNLGWGYHNHYRNGSKAIPYYEKAVSLNGNEAIYYSELDALYEMNNSPIDKRLELFDGKNEVVKNRDDAFIRQIGVLTLAGQPEKAVEFLEGVVFSYREGASRVREVIIDAHLMLGKKFYSEKKYQKALDNFFKAQVPEEEAGSARFGNREVQVNYFIGLAYDALGQKDTAITFYEKSAEQSRTSGIMTYYQGLSLERLGNNSRAKEVFETMVAEATEQLSNEQNGELGVIFGEKEAENTRKSQSHTLRGMGYKGLGKVKQAHEDLEVAIELSHSNLWAKVELNSAK